MLARLVQIWRGWRELARSWWGRRSWFGARGSGATGLELEELARLGQIWRTWRSARCCLPRTRLVKAGRGKQTQAGKGRYMQVKSRKGTQRQVKAGKVRPVKARKGR